MEQFDVINTECNEPSLSEQNLARVTGGGLGGLDFVLGAVGLIAQYGVPLAKPFLGKKVWSNRSTTAHIVPPKYDSKTKSLY
jgi:hypothetical protein